MHPNGHRQQAICLPRRRCDLIWCAALLVLLLPASGHAADKQDWAARSSAPDVLMATRFETRAEVEDWLAGGRADHVSWDTEHKASGGGALRFDILKSDAQAGGNWCRWLADDQREFGEGDRFFVQFRQYVPAYLATHAFKGGGGWKQAVVSRHAATMAGKRQVKPYGSNQLNEIVLQNTRHRSLVQGYNRNLAGKYPPWARSRATPCSKTDIAFQAAIDRGKKKVGNRCENVRARYGGLYSWYHGNERPGQPDPITGGFIYYPDEWVTYYLDIRIGHYGEADHRIRVYAARAGDDEYTLLHDVEVDLGMGPPHDALWLLPYNSGRKPDPARENTFTLYDEVIVSLAPIAVPE